MTDQLVLLGCHDGERFDIRCRFVKTDAGRSLSRRPRQTNDCTVRALTLVTGLPYDEVYDRCAAEGRKCGKGMHLKTWLPRAIVGGYRFRWIGLPARKGEWRANPVTFARDHPQGRFILRTAKHVLACVDGVVMDLSRDQGPMGLEWRCVYGAWEAYRE